MILTCILLNVDVFPWKRIQVILIFRLYSHNEFRQRYVTKLLCMHYHEIFFLLFIVFASSLTAFAKKYVFSENVFIIKTIFTMQKIKHMSQVVL